MARISIFGIGYVGVFAAACLARDGHDVIAVDVDPGKIKAINDGLSPIVENGLDDLIAQVVKAGRLRATADVQDAIDNTEASFVCCGTPSAPDGIIGLTYVEGVCRNIGRALANKAAYHSVVIRSTIVPGSLRRHLHPRSARGVGQAGRPRLWRGYYPEFLRESTAIEDYDEPGLIDFGAMDKGTAQFLTALNEGLAARSTWSTCAPPRWVKYTSNTWRAIKVTFANEIGNIAKASGIDGQTVMEILCSDEKVALSKYFHASRLCLWRVLPAQGRAGAPRARPVHRGRTPSDERRDRRERGADSARRGDGQGGRGGKSRFVGISFKPGTDDLRESPLAELAARLIADGIKVDIYDPTFRGLCRQQLDRRPRERLIPDLRTGWWAIWIS